MKLVETAVLKPWWGFLLGLVTILDALVSIVSLGFLGSKFTLALALWYVAHPGFYKKGYREQAEEPIENE
jgi:hypothetical protein